MGKIRRALAQVGRALGAGLVVGMRTEGPRRFAPNPWIRIDRDGTVTVIIDRAEMGQGVTTALAMLVAEELEVDLDRIRTEFAPAEPVYDNPMLREQTTGGSTSIRAAWEPLRRAGAAARETLIQAAAQTWGVAHAECRAAHGRVIHSPSGRGLGYGALVDKAINIPVVEDVPLKSADSFRILGKPAPRLEIPDMTTGRTLFGTDLTLPGLLVASLLRCPVIGGRCARVDSGRALECSGVRHVLEIDGGVAVVADDFWSAQQGRAALDVTWDAGPRAGLCSAAIRARFERAAGRGGTVAFERGDAPAVLQRSGSVIEAAYQTPYLAHATLEPMNCTARVHAGRCEVWVPTQSQQGAREAAARAAGLPESAVRVHTTFLGGGFGRRLVQDFVADAVQIATAVGTPVQLVRTRIDDMQHDFYRPANFTLLRAAVDGRGLPRAWLQRIVGPQLALDGVDVPYTIANLREEHVQEDPGVPTGPWRSVGASQNAFAIESFIDELARRAARDPLEYRLELLDAAPRHRGVLELAAQKVDWGQRPPTGRHRGIAVYRSFGSWVAQVAEVSVTAENGIKVHRVVCAIDCGLTVNPDTVAAQLEGAVAFGLSAAIKEEITVDRGRVQQATFEDYPILNMAEMPAVEVHIVPSREPPGGVGEPGVPPVAAAIANAVFAATGERLRSLPLRPTRCAQLGIVKNPGSRQR